MTTPILDWINQLLEGAQHEFAPERHQRIISETRAAEAAKRASGKKVVSKKIEAPHQMAANRNFEAFIEREVTVCDSLKRSYIIPAFSDVIVYRRPDHDADPRLEVAAVLSTRCETILIIRMDGQIQREDPFVRAQRLTYLIPLDA